MNCAPKTIWPLNSASGVVRCDNHPEHFVLITTSLEERGWHAFDEKGQEIAESFTYLADAIPAAHAFIDRLCQGQHGSGNEGQGSTHA